MCARHPGRGQLLEAVDAGAAQALEAQTAAKAPWFAVLGLQPEDVTGGGAGGEDGEGDAEGSAVLAELRRRMDYDQYVRYLAASSVLLNGDQQARRSAAEPLLIRC